MKYIVWALCLALSDYGNGQTANGQVRPQPVTQGARQIDYLLYHRDIAEAERLIGEREYEQALSIYEASFSNYPTGFLKDYRIATQLAFYLKKPDQAFNLLKEGIENGWEIKNIKREGFYKHIKGKPEWKTIKSQYLTLRGAYLKSVRSDVRETVHQMFRSDQKKALRALFHFTSRAQDRYAERIFAPHSEKQVRQLNQIIDAHGYPGERLIGNNYWASVILAHHNSISTEYVKKDTLYPRIRGKLLKAMELGQISPYEFARVDDWYMVIKGEGKDKGYGLISQVG